MAEYFVAVQMWSESARIDRAAKLRQRPGAIEELWHDVTAQLIMVNEKGGVSARKTDQQERHWLNVYARTEVELATEKPKGPYNAQKHIFMGLVGSEPRFAMLRPGLQADNLRELLPKLSDLDRELAVFAVAIANWHRSNLYCPKCGGATRMIMGGMARNCGECATESFPRHDPATIVAVIDENDRLLLGHQHSWAEGRYSILAGFVEAGESLEQCVHRELLEEANIRITKLDYVGSQPWPFPRSLMCGFIAHCNNQTPKPDGVELQDVRFFTRDEINEKISSGQMSLPGSASVSSHLIEAWLADQLDQVALKKTIATVKQTIDIAGPKPEKRGW